MAPPPVPTDPTDPADPADPAQIALRSMVRRFIVFFVAGMAVIAAFAIAYWIGAFTPSPR
jgi:hypothetical protein